MRNVAISLLVLLISLTAFGQTLNMSINGKVEHMPNDLDAKVYYPVKDWNDNLCALIKVRTTNELSSPLVLDVGGIGLKERREMENGEIWFYVPYQAKNLRFTCKGYTDVPPVSVQLQAGAVYLVNLITDAALQVVHNAVLSSNYLKIAINEPNATLSVGKSKNYELLSTVIDGKQFNHLLDYGIYYYKVEHPLFETVEGSITLGANTPKINIEMKPTYGLLTINSDPSGAKVYIDNKEVGTTPCNLDTRFPKGDISIRLQTTDYYPLIENINIYGNGERQYINLSLTPQFGTVTCSTPDKDAEIWIDDVFKGNGSWTGRLSSLSQHKLEAKKAGHQSQSILFRVQDGETSSHTVGAPVPLFGTIAIESTPSDATVKIDGKEVGITPLITQVVSGNHSIEISLNGYQALSLSAQVEHNKTTSINRSLNVTTADGTKSKIKNISTEDIIEANSIYSIGKLYYNEKEYSPATELLEQAAELGDPRAQNLLGTCYYDGKGVPADQSEAIYWYEHAAKQNYTAAQIFLGYCHSKNNDNISALKWMRNASEHNLERSIYQVESCDLSEEYSQAIEWQKGISQKNGFSPAMVNIGNCYFYGYGVNQDYRKAVKWYKMAADKEYEYGILNLAYCYIKGIGVNQSILTAMKLLRKIADRGNSYAQLYLGDCYNSKYNNGKSISPSRAEAIKWYKKAVEGGNADAKKRLEELGAIEETTTKEENFLMGF